MNKPLFKKKKLHIQYTVSLGLDAIEEPVLLIYVMKEEKILVP